MPLPTIVLSAIVACYRDEKTIGPMAERLTQVFLRLGVTYEIIFVNDASPDGSRAVLDRLALSDSRVKVIAHSRNFGSQSAFYSGLRVARGEACIFLDGDLQDPPEVIPAFFQKWGDGFDVVYGIRDRREMAWVAEIFYRAYYRIFRWFASIDVPVDASDFSLMDRNVCDALLALPERDLYLRALRSWVGFRQTGVVYHRPKRKHGSSGYSVLAKLRWGKREILSFSGRPVEWASTAALVGAIVSVVVAGAVGGDLLVHGGDSAQRLLFAALFLGGIQLFGLFVVVEYVGRIFEEIKRRPRAIVSGTQNLEALGAALPAAPDKTIASAPESRVGDRRASDRHCRSDHP